MAIGKGITLRSRHVGKIDIDEEQARELALKSTRIDNMLKDGVEEAEFSVSLKVLQIAISFCTQLVHHHHLLLHTRGEGGGGENIKEEIRKKIAGFDRPVLMEFVTAMDQLLMKELLDMACYEAIRRIKGRKTDSNVRNTFNIRYMYLDSEEEIDELKRENELVGIGVSAELMVQNPGEVDALEDEDSLSKKISSLYSILRERYQEIDGFFVEFELNVSRLEDYTQRSFVNFFLNHKPKDIIKHFIRRLELSDARHEYYLKLHNKLCEISATTDEKADLMSIKLMKDNADDVKVKVDQIISDMQISDFFKNCQEYEGTVPYLSVLKEEHYAMIDEILLYVDLSLQPRQRVILRTMERSQIEMLETDTELQNKQDEQISKKDEPELPSSKYSEDSRLNSNISMLEEFKNLSSQVHYVCRQHNFLSVLRGWILCTLDEKMSEVEEATSWIREEFRVKLLDEIHPKIAGHDLEFYKARTTFINCEVHEHSSEIEHPQSYKNYAMNLINLAEQGRHKVDTDLRKLISQYGEDNISDVVLDLFSMRQCSYQRFNRCLNVDEVRGVLYEEDETFRSRKMKGVPLRGEHVLEE